MNCKHQDGDGARRNFTWTSRYHVENLESLVVLMMRNNNGCALGRNCALNNSGVLDNRDVLNNGLYKPVSSAQTRDSYLQINEAGCNLTS